MRSIREYRQEAKEYTYKDKKILALIYFIYMIIFGVSVTLGFSYAAGDGAGSFIYNIDNYSGYGSIIATLLEGPFALSFVKISIKLYRKQRIEINDLFLGFKDFVPAFLISLLVNVFVGLWMLLFIIPAFVMVLAYSMAYYIHEDEPKLRPIECIKKSRAIMDGHKTQLLGLYLSYFWAFILGILTFGIYLYFIIPRINMASYLFYLDITKQQPHNNIDLDIESKDY